MNRLIELFEDKEVVNRIKKRLPYLFQLAELESSRAGKVGMEVGSLREKILVALLIYKFGEENVDTVIPITEPEVDVKLFGEPISIKTITGLGGVKLIWTVDAQKAKEFRETYIPKTDILLAIVKWNNKGLLSYIPLEVQKEVFQHMGRQNYIKLPKPGTNPRGVEITRKALLALLKNKNTKSIDIAWIRQKIDYKSYNRWVEYWKKD